MNSCLVALAALSMCLLFTATVATDDVSVNCGSSEASAGHSGRVWLGDLQPRSSSVMQIKGASFTSTATLKSTSADPVPFKTARLSRSQFSYLFKVNPGQKMIRLHFNPTSYRGFEGLVDLFTVEAAPFTLLSNFSASLAADALGADTFVEEFWLNIQENQHLIIVFSPKSSQTLDTYAFINGIEIIGIDGVAAGLEVVKLPPPQGSLSQSIRVFLASLVRRNANADVAIAMVSSLCTIAHKLRDIWEGSSSEEEHKPSPKAARFCRRFSLSEIQLATRYFSEELLVGKGGFGNVYRGLIDEGQMTVAVKKLNPKSMQGAREFLTEIETLSQLRHVNLVSLIGYCNEHGEMILVYDYMACGTLGDHSYKTSRKRLHCPSLTWEQRLNICIGAGRGLDYLHTGHGVIHRDVKASNILLDENFTAKVSDFGLAKHAERSRLWSHVSTNVKLELALEQQHRSTQILMSNEISSSWEETGYSGETRQSSESNIVEQTSNKEVRSKLSRFWSWNKVNSPKEDELLLSEIRETNVEMTIFDWSTLSAATKRFSSSNKVGKGGFGPVYKGVLPSGEVVAVKMHSTSSTQSLQEFKNEILLLPNLHHQNIIKLLGYCIHSRGKLLVYEFMENKSLDTFIDEEKKQDFPWPVRFNVIKGIARGLVYLHQHSTLKVIHGDPKSSNILLDKDMVPKISDFGFSRTLSEHQFELETGTAAGTPYYISPERLKQGKVSVKSDVYSFGVVILEVVSGQRAWRCYSLNKMNLDDYARKVRREGKVLHLLDGSVGGAFSAEEVVRCIQVALRCTLEHPDDRPPMRTVLGMLDGDVSL